MEYDITHTIAKFVREADAQLATHQEPPALDLTAAACINWTYGRWVDLGIEYLLSVFVLDDEDFVVRLPILAHLKKAERQRFARGLTDHLHACSYCARKHKEELAMNARIESALQDNSDMLLRQLRSNGNAI
jgi:hypothetical protein